MVEQLQHSAGLQRCFKHPCTPAFHAAVLQRELGSALVLEQEISNSSKKFLKFQGDKLKIRG